MKRYLERFIALVIIVTLSTLGTLAPVQPAAAFTIGEEREVGEKLLYTVRSAFELVDDPDVTQYINNLGQRSSRSPASSISTITFSSSTTTSSMPLPRRPG